MRLTTRVPVRRLIAILDERVEGSRIRHAWAGKGIWVEGFSGEETHVLLLAGFRSIFEEVATVIKEQYLGLVQTPSATDFGSETNLRHGSQR